MHFNSTRSLEVAPPRLVHQLCMTVWRTVVWHSPGLCPGMFRWLLPLSTWPPHVTAPKGRKVLFTYCPAFILEENPSQKDSIRLPLIPPCSNLSDMPFLVAREAFSSLIVESRKAKLKLGMVVKRPSILVCHKNLIKKQQHWLYKIFNNRDGAITNQIRV